MPQLVSDETWNRLDPRQGALTGGQRLRVTGALVAVVLVAVLGFKVWSTGLLRPRLAFADTPSSWAADPLGHTFTLTMILWNEGSSTARVTAIGRSGTGLRLLKVAGGTGTPTSRVTDPAAVPDLLPITLSGDAGIEVSLSYRVTDCAAAEKGDWPIPITAERPGPDPTVAVLPPSRSFTAQDGFGALPWQEAMVKDACSKLRTPISGVSD